MAGQVERVAGVEGIEVARRELDRDRCVVPGMGQSVVVGVLQRTVKRPRAKAEVPALSASFDAWPGLTTRACVGALSCCRQEMAARSGESERAQTGERDGAAQ
ncbi:MAG: hypothetical protein IT457_06080 [Planctomycetes bacterium]|nr:hypothetical protein [Planctomycetota bacterium]